MGLLAALSVPCLFAVLCLAQATTNLTLLGSFSAANAGFLDIVDFGSSLGKGLIISQFTGNPFASDVIGAVWDLAAVVNSANISGTAVVSLTDSVVWPNTVTQLSSGAIGGVTGDALLVAGGFLVPPKSVGAVAVLEFDSATGALTKKTNISQDLGNTLFDGWFYHKAYPMDVDGDGCLDVMTARATKPLVRASAGELVWLKQPCGGGDPLAPSAVPWEEAVLVNGSFAPDVFTAITSFGGSDLTLVFTSYFSGGGFGIVQCASCNASAGGTSSWANASLAVTIIDASIGLGFAASLADLNNDGVLDVLVTNHVDNATGSVQSGVFAYVAPAPPTSVTNASAWTKYTLASGFVVREFGPGQAAPGTALPVPYCGGANRKPFITLAGDGDQRFYTLTPNSEDPSDWTYTLEEVFDCKGTVGAQVAQDVDGDGCPELFVPCYDSGTIHVFRVQS